MLSGNDGVKGAENYSMLMLNMNGELLRVFAEALRGGTHEWYDMPWDAKEYELMQFTGLLDKNGKEIYEGDRVKSRYGTVEVRFDYGKFEPFDASGEYGWFHSEAEVIGNVYENPDLPAKDI